jgi:hypothetical protein
MSFRLPCLLLLLLAGAVSAQSPAGDSKEAAPSRAEVPDEQPAEGVNSGEPVADGSLPPDDYEASEQISEDLSVSFPVDI